MPIILITALSIIAAFYVFKDATARDMRAKSWSVAILLSSMLALPVYLLARRRKQIG